MTAAGLIRNIPVPVCGLALGMASLDRFLSQNHDFYTYGIFAAFSAFLIVLFTLRMVVSPGTVRKDLESPILFGVLPTYQMTVMILSTYVVGFSDVLAKAIWLTALVSMFAMMPLFLRRFAVGFDMRKVFPSWFVMFIGCVVGSVTSAALGFTDVGRGLFWFGLAAYAVLFPLILYRALVIRGIPEPAIPNLAIFAAPPNLLLAGYLAAFGAGADEMVVTVLMVLGVTSYLAVLAYMPFMMRRRFYPSYGAFTFPMVISMVSINAAGVFLGLSDGPFRILEIASEVIAVCFVVYVLIRYAMFFGETFANTGTG